MGSGNVKPSPSVVLGIIALVLAFGGTAIAGPDALSRAVTKAKVKQIAKKQADTRITQRAPDLAVASAVSSNPAAFAHVLADGTVDTANSKGIVQANVTNGSPPGYYCFSGLSFTPRGGNVTLDWNSAGSIDVIAAFGLGDNPSCTSPADFFVDIRDAPTGSGSVPSAFFLTLYR